MRYAGIIRDDFANGEGVGVCLYTQGCRFHCKGCFNQETWDLDGGKEWFIDYETKIINLLSLPRISRLSIIGGEPLIEENLEDLIHLLINVKYIFEDKIKIWLWTGYTFEELSRAQKEVLKFVDVLIDGKFEEDKKDLSIPFRGSSNQRLLNCKESLNKNKPINYLLKL